jgi:hypothetical protein
MNGEGDWESDACAKRGFPSLSQGSPGLKLEAWNARLYKLNEEFCRQNEIPARRVPIADLRPAQATATLPVLR